MNSTVGLPGLLKAAQDGDAASCERIFEENSGLVWSVVRRFFGRGLDPDDLYQLGCIGFLKAVQGFDPAFGTQFSTYAVPKIAGEIRRFLRDDGPIKVSRRVKEKALAVKKAREILCQRLGRDPQLSELSAYCEMTVEDIASIEMATAPTESFQRENGEEGQTLEGAVGVDGLEDEIIRKLALRESIDKLSEKERKVILLRYFKGLTQEKVSKIMGVSQVQISRIERRAVANIRNNMAV